MPHQSNSSPDDPLAIPLEPAAPAPKRAVCRVCYTERFELDAPCPKCGFDPRQGLRESTTIGKRPLGKQGLTCGKCGYDVTGLPSLRCPECGTAARPPSLQDRYREDSKRIAREAYRTPLLMLLIAGGVLTGLLFVAFGPAEAGLYLLKYAIEVPIGVAVFLLCCMIWIGFDAPIHLTALRLAGIYAVVDVVQIGTGVFLPGLLAWFIAVVVYVALLAELLELDWQDAAVVGLLTFIAKAVLGMMLIAAMMDA